ncbi:hypothetical protein Tco_0576990 [Tanacetum coccineum]
MIESRSHDIKRGIIVRLSLPWSTIKHAYDKDAAKGIKYWAERRKLWYRSQMNKFSKQNVYSTQKILSVKSVSVKKVHGYGHLEEVLMKRVDRQLYNQNWRDLPRDIPLDRIEVLRYDTKGVKVRKGKMQTKTELTLEQTQQGVSDEVLNIRVILKSIHSDDGNTSRANIKQAVVGDL